MDSLLGQASFSRRSFGFRELLPEPVRVAEGLVGEIRGTLFPAEAQQIARATEQRRAEFSAGRALAREALNALGVIAGALVADRDGVPQWPAGVTGCITHSFGHAAAAAARCDDLQGLGIDVEAVPRFGPELEPHVLCATEIERELQGRPPSERQARTAALFCAKEAWFKCQFPITRRPLGFRDVHVLLEDARGTFVISPIGDAQDAGAGVSGRFAVAGGLARATIVLKAGTLSAPARAAWKLPHEASRA